MKLLILSLLLLPIAVEAKPASPTSAKQKKAAKDLTSLELRETAESELRVDSSKHALVPLANSDSLVSTADLVQEEERELLGASEFELGGQTYRPMGMGRISPGETYSYAGLSSKPMLLVGMRHWFLQRLRTSAPIRAGISLQGGFSSNTLKITTNRGFAYDDVHLNSFLALAGPELEYFLDGHRRWAVGFRAAAGRLLSSQSGRNSVINQSQSAGLWEGEGHIRFQPSRTFYLRAAYARRANLGANNQGLRTQQNNYGAFLGFAM